MLFILNTNREEINKSINEQWWRKTLQTIKKKEFLAYNKVGNQNLPAQSNIYSIALVSLLLYISFIIWKYTSQNNCEYKYGGEN